MTQPTAISLENVRKSYGSFELGPVDLTVEPGHVVALVGPNGGGKSTLLKVLMNLTQPDSGTVTVLGGTYPQDEVRIKQSIGYVPERSSGHDEMGVKTLGEFVSRFYPSWDQTLYEDHLARLGTEPRKKFGRLSKGAQGRLVFALALATGAEMLLLDEPTAGADALARRRMLEDISGFVRSGGRTVVFATHAIEEVRRIADYVAVLVDGEFLGLHEKDALLERWKTLWVDGEPGEGVPGVVRVDSGTPTRLVSDSPGETAQALCARGVRTVRAHPVDLEEVLSHMMRRSGKGPGS